MSDPEPKSSVVSQGAAQKLANISSGLAPFLPLSREGFPILEVSRKMLETKKGGKSRLSVDDLHNVVFCRFLLGFLQEPVHQIRVTEFHLQLLGVGPFLDLVAETIRTIRQGGLAKKSDAKSQRTPGGVFFEVIRLAHPDVAKAMRKWKKKTISAISVSKGWDKRAAKGTPGCEIGNPPDIKQSGPTDIKQSGLTDQGSHRVESGLDESRASEHEATIVENNSRKKRKWKGTKFGEKRSKTKK